MKIIFSTLFLILTSTLVAQIPSYVPTSGLVGWWPFSGNANDLSGNGNNGTVNGATLTTDRFGSANQAYYFTNNKIEIPHNSSLGFQQNQGFTVSVWAKKNAGFTTTHLMGKRPSGAQNFNWHIADWEGIQFSSTSAPNVFGAITTIPVETNTWTNIVGIFSNGTWSVYINGNLATTNSSPYFYPDVNTPLVFGNSGDWGGFMGKLDDIGIWNRALTQTEVTALFTTTPAPTPPTVAITPASTSICAGTSTTLSATATAGSTVCSSSQLPTSLQSGLVGYWPFCGNANDESGNGNNGTVNGATLTTDRFGNASSAYSFDGVNDHVVVQDIPILKPSNSISLCAWVNINMSEQSNFNAIINKSHNQSQNYSSYSLITGNTGWNQTGNPGFTVRTTSSYNWTGANGTSTQVPGQNILNQWQFVCGTWDGTNMKIYQNGVLIATVPQSGTIIYNTENLFFGKRKDGNGIDDYFTGLIDDIGIWNRALTATEIQQLYTLGNTTYSWSPGGATTPSITVSPTATTTYTCTATANGVSASASSIVTVNPTPTITATNSTVCAGQSTTLTASTSGSTACPTLTGTLSSGLVGYWPFCGNANDASGNGNNGTVDGATLTTDRFGNANSAYSFDGVNDVITVVPTSQIPQNSNYSWSFWFNSPSSDYNGAFLNSYSWFVKLGHDFPGLFYKDEIGNQTNSWYIQQHFNTQPSVNQWHNLTIVKNGNSVSLYIDNTNVGSTTTYGHVNFDSSFLTQFGYYCCQMYFQGKLDDFSLWNRALTATEIQQLYNQGQTTYSWSPGGATTPSITVSPTTTTTYTCTVTDGNGNSCSQDQLITVNPTPNVNAGADQNICSGSTTTLTATGAATYSWTNSIQNGVAFTPIATNTYTVTGTNANGCTGTDAVTVTLVPTPTITATNTTICAGQSTTLTAANSGQSSGILYSITKNVNSQWSVSWPVTAGANYQLKVVGTYGIANGVQGLDAAFETATQIPYNQACTGYQDHWLLSDGCPARPTPDVYNANNTYYYNILNSDGSIDFSFADCCYGDNTGSLYFELTPLPATYSWSPGGATTPSITVSPTTTTTYTCTVTDANGNSCASTQTITVNPTPTVNAGADLAVCNGSTATLTATGATTYSWTNNVQNGVAFTPIATNTYTVTGTNANGCTGTDAVTVTLVPTPTITATNTTICAGQSTTLTASTSGSTGSTACPTISGSLSSGLVGFWPFCGNANDASGNGNNGTVNGATLTTDRFGNVNSAYSFNGSNDIVISSNFYNNGFTNSTISVWFNTASTTQLNQCVYNTIPHDGEAFVWNHSNAPNHLCHWKNQNTSIHLWNIFSANTLNYSSVQANNWIHISIVKSNLTYTYYVNGNVDKISTATLAAINEYVGMRFGSIGGSEFFNGKIDDIAIWNRSLTSAEIQELYTTGQTNYSWSPGGATTPSITVSPTTTTTYTCTVTDANGNSCSQDQLITVNPTPTVNAGADLAVCNGSTATLTATGAATYSWTNNVQNGVAFTPIATNTYTVTGTNANGCTGTDAVTVTLVPTPTISATNTSVCAGQSTTLTAAASGSTGSSTCPTLSGTLSSGLVGFWPFCGNANDASGNGNNGTVNGATLTTDRFGNANSAYSFDGVNDYINVNEVTEMEQNQHSISFWYNASANPQSRFDLIGKDNSNGNRQYVVQLESTNKIRSAVFTDQQQNVLDANTAININSWTHVTVVWNGSVNKIYINGVLDATASASGNLLQANWDLFFGGIPSFGQYLNGKLDDIGFWNRSLSTTEIQQLYTQGQITYSWSPGGATTPSITVSPTTTTTYTCTVTDASGNSCAATQTITVIPFTGVNAGADQSICNGGSVTLNATGASTYSWNNSVQNGVAFSPLSSGTYIVTGTQNGCTDADTVAVTVVADPTITSPAAASYCQNGGTVTPLSVSVAGGIASAYAYQWYANTTVNNFGGTPVLGATTSFYTPPINTVGTTFYYCTVTQGAAGNGCLATSGANSIVVNAQPTITSQPVASQNGCVGAALTPLTLAISGGNGTPTYQWYANTTASTSGGVSIPGATNSSFTPSNTTAGTYYFYCVASFPNATSCATKTSAVATVTLINDPIFTIPPTASQSVCIGGTIPALTFNSSGGSGTASYQWYAVNGSTYTTILGATNPSYTPPIFNVAGTYAYAVAISQTAPGCASGFSPLANVTVVADPNVSSPSAANYCQGGLPSNPLTVTATAGINSGYAYQWFSNGSNNNNTSGIAISGATAAAYTPPTSAVGTLYYYCQVNQGAGCSVNSTPAAITVVPGPAFTSQPLPSQTVCAGASLNALSVAYSGGTGTPTYQWYSSTTNNNLGGTPLAGASNASFTPNPNVVGLNYYYCQVSFAALTTCASISSNVAQVNVISNPVFSSSPLANQTICQGAGAQTLSFATSGGTGSASYQWYNVNGSNYTPILGATGLTYTPPSNLPIGTYNYAVAMNQVASGCSTGFSSNAQLVVLAQPVLSAPIGGVYCQGGSGQALSVSVSGGNGASNYQWYQNTANTNSGGTAIAGATSSSYLPSLVNFGTLYYYCVVTQNAGCAASSSVATVVSNPNPVISTQPTAIQTICVGSAPTPLSTSYTGGVGTPSYQWYVNNQNTTLGGSAIAGANASTYLLGNQVGLGSNYYYCVVTLANSSCLQATTNIATVNTVANPIVNGPTSTTYCQSTSVAQALSVSASGGNGTSYTYQWYSNVNNANFGGNPILGANNPNYTPNINGSSLNYYCVVTQPGGCQTTSAVASIEIVPTPGVSSQPLAGQTICVGGTPQALSIAIVGGVSNPSFQWYSNTVNTSTNASLIPNASSATYTPNTASNTGTTYYFCQVSFTANSACPTLVSNAASIIVASDPVVSNPSNANYCQNATSVTPLSVTASGGINTSYTYQWYSNTNNSNVGGTPIAGANSSSYIPLVNQIGTNYYYCEVTQGSGCTALSGVSTISVGTAASINQQPISSQNLCLGQNASTLTVGVSAGNYAVSYQWYSNVSNNNFGGSVIVGATNAFYTPPSTALGTKYYYCVIAIAGGGCGNLTSNTAVITVLNAPTMFQPNSQTVCCQSSTTPINFVGNASSYSWTASSSSPLLTGFSSAGNGNIPSNVLTNNSTTPQNIVYLVTPSNQGCAGTPVQFNISVLPCMSVSVPSDQYYCAGESVPAYVFSGVGQTYSWVNTNTTIGLQNAGINFVPNFVAQNNTATTQVATITVTPNFMGCAGTPQSYSISVYPLPTVDAGVDQEICSGGSVTLTANGAPNLVWDNGILNGQTFVPNATTTYTVTGTDNNGCQNSDAVVVTVNSPTSATLNATTCDAYTLNGQTYTASGTYSQLLSNSEGCDSTLTLNLTVNFSPNQPNIYVQNQVNLSTDLVPGLTYQWITCSDLTPISGQTAITYNPTSNGVYAVVVSNGCGSDTSLCTSITTIGLDEHLSSQILLYPNPNNGVFTLEMPQALIGQTIQLFDMAGRLIEESTAQELKQHIELKDVATGSYWLRIGSEIPMKLVKN